MALTISSSFDAGQHPRRQARTATAPTWRSSRTTCPTSTNGSISALPAPRAAKSPCGSPIARASAYPARLARLQSLPVARPRGMGPHHRHQLRRRRADDEADPAAGPRVDRLFRALFDGAAPRPRDPDRGARRRRLSLARQEPRRPGHRLPDHRRGPAQRLALRPPAPRRDAWPNGGWKARSRN